MKKELMRFQPPYFHICGDEKENVLEYISKHDDEISKHNITVLKIDGNNCLDYKGVLKEFKDQLQFPDYFGYNWAALDECINDLEWIEAEAYLLVVFNIEKVLLEDEADFKIFIKILKGAVEEWVQGREYGCLVTPPTPFHIVFHCKKDKINEMKAKLVRFDLKDLKELRLK